MFCARRSRTASFARRPTTDPRRTDRHKVVTDPEREVCDEGPRRSRGDNRRPTPQGRERRCEGEVHVVDPHRSGTHLVHVVDLRYVGELVAVPGKTRRIHCRIQRVRRPHHTRHPTPVLQRYTEVRDGQVRRG